MARTNAVEYDTWAYQAQGTTPPLPLSIRFRFLRLVAVALIVNGWPRLRKWQ